MCGIAGTVGLGGGALVGLMDLAATRGPHAWGVAYPNHAIRKLGRFQEHALPPGPIRLGHCRLATDGHPDDLARTQPLARGGLALAHNGVIAGIDTTRRSDSAHLLEDLWARSGPLSARLEASLATLGVTRHALALTDWRTVVLSCDGLPIWLATYPDGAAAWCSRPFSGATALNGMAEIPWSA